MAWQGVPFLLNDFTSTGKGTFQFPHVSIDKLPSIIVESSFSWETLIAAIIAGAIPAIIAYVAIQKNNELAILQNKMQSQTKVCEEIRIASASYVTSVNVLASEYTEWSESVKHLGIMLGRFQKPDGLKKAIYDVELSKNTLIILITPDIDGNVLLSKMAETQTALKPFLDTIARARDIEKLNKSNDDFIWQCHEYLQKKQNV